MKWSSELAEFLGAFALVLAGTGAIVVDEMHGGIGTLGIAVAFGLAVGAMIYAVGHVSGAHFNPAVTIAFAATRHFPWTRVPTYLLSQLLGALAASAVLAGILGRMSLGATAPAAGVSTGGAFLLEFILTMLLMFVIASVATDGRAVGQMAGTAIGSMVLLNALWAGPLTGAGMNPARSLAPAIVGGGWADSPLWMYVAAPVAGALVGAALYEATRRGDRPAGRRS